MAPVTLQMEVHCYGCRNKIRKAVKKADPDWEGEVLFLDNGNVVVTGNPNGPLVRQAVERKMKTSVKIIYPPVAATSEPDWSDQPVSEPRYYY